MECLGRGVGASIHPQTLGVPGLPPPHVWGEGHEPQLTVPPQPLVTVPQFLTPQACAAVSGVQAQTPEAAHIWPVGHVPQAIVPPQPLVTVPQFLTPQACAAVSGVQAQTLGVPAPPQVCGATHVPQLTVRRLPQLSRALTVPQFLPRREQNRALLSRVHAERRSPLVGSVGSTDGASASDPASLAPGAGSGRSDGTPPQPALAKAAMNDKVPASFAHRPANSVHSTA
jgi:hypothetical protein